MEMANLLSQGEANLGRLVQQRTKLLDIIRQESGAESNKAKLAEQEIQKLKFILVQRTQLGATLDKRLAAIKSENKLLNIQNKGVKDVTANLGKAVGMQIMYGLSSAATAKKITASVNKGSQEIYGLVPKAGDQLQGYLDKVWTVGKAILGTVGGPFLSFIAEKSGEVMKDMTNSVFASLSSTVKALDSNYRGMVMNLGHHTDQFKEIFLANMSAVTFSLSEQGGFSKELKNLGRFLEDVYIDPKDSQEAMEALYNTASIFHEEMRDGRNVSAGYISNMVAGFKKLGVSTKDSASMINVASKALGKTPIMSVEFMKSIKNVGSALGKNIGDTFQEFIGMGSKLTMFGDKVTGVFGRIASQAKAAGMQTKDLMDIAMEFDTFEGAAKAAGQLNAVLGQTAIDAMSLVHADPDKKIEMIRDAISGSVGEFSELDRRTKQVIAGIITGGDVMKAQQMLSNKESFEAYAKDLKKVTDGGGNIKAETNEALESQMRQAGSIEQILNGAAANMANALDMLTGAQRKIAQGLYLAAEGAGAVANNIAKIPAGVSKVGSEIRDFMGFGPAQGFSASQEEMIASTMAATNAKLKAMGFTEKEIQDMQQKLSASSKEFFTAEAKKARKAADEEKNLNKDRTNRAAKARAKSAPSPGIVPKGKVQGFADTNVSVQNLSSSMKKIINTDMLKFNQSLRNITTSAEALRTTLEGIGNSPALKNLASALSAAKPLEVRTGPELPVMGVDLMKSVHAGISATDMSGLMKDVLGTPIDRRTRQLIDDIVSGQKKTIKSISNSVVGLVNMTPEEKSLLASPVGPQPLSAEKEITNLKTETLTIEQQAAPMAALVDKIDKLITKLETNTAAETNASNAVIEAMKTVQIKLAIDGRDLKRPVRQIVEEIRT